MSGITITRDAFVAELRKTSASKQALNPYRIAEILDGRHRFSPAGLLCRMAKIPYGSTIPQGVGAHQAFDVFGHGDVWRSIPDAVLPEWLGPRGQCALLFAVDEWGWSFERCAGWLEAGGLCVAVGDGWVPDASAFLEVAS